jgi:hypothetical protein
MFKEKKPVRKPDTGKTVGATAEMYRAPKIKPVKIKKGVKK